MTPGKKTAKKKEELEWEEEVFLKQRKLRINNSHERVFGATMNNKLMMLLFCILKFQKQSLFKDSGRIKGPMYERKLVTEFKNVSV